MPAPARHHRCAVVALVAAVVNAYPEYVNCGEELRIGQRWMGRDSEASTLAVSLTDAATNAPIACGSTVASGTRVRATIANLDSSEQYVLEATGGVAYGNFCIENTRAMTNHSSSTSLIPCPWSGPTRLHMGLCTSRVCVSRVSDPRRRRGRRSRRPRRLPVLFI